MAAKPYFEWCFVSLTRVGPWNTIIWFYHLRASAWQSFHEYPPPPPPSIENLECSVMLWRIHRLPPRWSSSTFHEEMNWKFWYGPCFTQLKFKQLRWTDWDIFSVGMDGGVIMNQVIITDFSDMKLVCVGKNSLQYSVPLVCYAAYQVCYLFRE